MESYPYLQTMRHPNLSIPPSCSENVYLIWYLGLQVKSEVLIITQRKPSRKCENCSETSPWNWKIILLTSIKISNSKAKTSLAKFKVLQEITKYLKYLLFKVSRFSPMLLGHCCAGCHAGLVAGTGSSLYNFTPWHIKLLCLWLSGWFVPSVSRNME